MANTTTFKHAWLPLDRMEAHPQVQRGFRKAHAEAIAANFDPDCFGELYVVPRPRTKDRYWIFDGQHRHWAAITALGADQKVYCRVYSNRPLEELAWIQEGVGTQKAWRAIDRFRLRVMRQEEQARTITKILADHGLKVQLVRGEGVVQATSACDWVVEKAGGAEALGRVVSILHNAWGLDPDAYHQQLIKGVALLCNRYNGDLDDRDLALKLKKQSGPARVIGRARDFSKTVQESVARATARVLAMDYNRGRRSRRLPDWQ